MHKICSPEFLSFVSRRQSNNFLAFFLVPATSTSTRYGWLEISALAQITYGRGFNCRAISIKISMFPVFMSDSNLSEGSFWCSSHNANILKHEHKAQVPGIIFTRDTHACDKHFFFCLASGAVSFFSYL